MLTPLLIYGANGYTGELIARQAVAQGLRPTLAGRNAAAVTALANQLDLPHLAVSLGDEDALERALRGHMVVLHCAGPFSRTSSLMAAACLRTGVHYCDITGEIMVFEALARQDTAAQAADVMLLPGAGFDVVPSDCLAAHLKRRLPTATSLELAFRGLGRASRGTITTALEGINKQAGQGAVRRNGQIVPAPMGQLIRQVDFGRGPVTVTAIPWGDVSTAYHSTGIPNITVYTYMPPTALTLLRLGRPLMPLLAASPAQDLLRGLVRRGPPGPSPEERAAGLSLLWGEARDDAGHCVAARVRAPEGYTLTAMSAVLIAERILAGQWRAGFQTPSRVYGPDLLNAITGVERVDLLPIAPVTQRGAHGS
jgi:short subunit dehydrogenase-like uncharacterized protein